MRLLITGAWGQAAQYIPEIEEMGHEVSFLQFEKDPLPCPADWPEGIIGNGIFLSHPAEAFTSLRYLQLTSAGYDRVPMDLMAARGVEVRNARGVYSIPMAEFAAAGVLSLYKEMDYFRDNQRQHRWNKHRGLRELQGSHVVILGCGSVGTECAARFRAFGCQITGIDLFPRQDPLYDRMEGLGGLDGAVREADVLILTLPLTEETRGLMDSRRLRSLKEDAVVVNIARGGLLDMETLAQLLAEGRLGGAVLDVFEEEPLDPDSPLWDLPRLIVTPHNSFVGQGNGSRLSSVILRNLQAYRGDGAARTE